MTEIVKSTASKTPQKNSGMEVSQRPQNPEVQKSTQPITMSSAGSV